MSVKRGEGFHDDIRIPVSLIGQVWCLISTLCLVEHPNINTFSKITWNTTAGRQAVPIFL